MTTDVVTGLFYLAIGLIICFAGFRFFRLFLMIAGFLVGFNLVMSTGNSATIDFNNIPLLAVAVIVGIIVAVLSWVLYRFGVAIAGGIAGASIATILAQALAVTGLASTLMIVIGIIIGALLAFAITDLIIMISTSISGARFAVAGLALLAPQIVTGPIILILAILLAAFGFVSQWGTGGRDRRALI